jgi:hypothetical protein
MENTCLWRIFKIKEIEALNPCNLVRNATKTLSFLAHCRRDCNGRRGLVVSVEGSEGRVASSSDSRSTPSVKTAMSWSIVMSAARLAGIEARLLVRLSIAMRMVRVYATSEWTWDTIFGVSLVAET